ncbi:MAG TPA: hypothetical protein VGM62_11905 [Chthoniobacterales bacterium]
MPRCAFLTLAETGDYVIDDELAYKPLEALGWKVAAVPWNQTANRWEDFDVVVIRSTWDYHLQVEEFLSVLTDIDRSSARLENALSLVRWNLDKRYLKDLAARGIATAPTIWRDGLNQGGLGQLLDEVAGWSDFVLKPVLSANALGAFRLGREVSRERTNEVERYFARRPFLAQPFIPQVVDEGEFSLCYFNGSHSHTLLKTPKKNDFRVQEEHGGFIRAVEAETALLEAGRKVMNSLETAPLYARADFVRAGGKSFWLMELELVEPSLYLRVDPEAPARFARSLHERMKN